jgi:hypothetical protein
MPVKKKESKKKVTKNIAQKGSSISKSKSSAKSSVVVKIDQRKITKGRASAPAPKQITTFIGSSQQPIYIPQYQQSQPSISFAPVVSQDSATKVSEKYPGRARIIGEPTPTANYMNRTPYNPTIDVNMTRVPVTETLSEDSYRLISYKPPKSQISIATPEYVKQVSEKIKTPFPTREILRSPEFAQGIDTELVQTSTEQLPSETVSIGGIGYYGVGDVLPPDTGNLTAEPLTNKSKKTITKTPVESKISNINEVPFGVEYEEDIYPNPSINPSGYDAFGLKPGELNIYALFLGKTPQEAQSILRKRIYERKGARNLEPRLLREISLEILKKAQKKYEKAPKTDGGKSK